MIQTPQALSTQRRSAGRIATSWVVLMALLALALSAVIYLALNRDDADDTDAPKASQAQIDTELAALQQDFQTAMLEKQDLTRHAALARAFTQNYPESQGGYVFLAQTRMGMKQWDQAYAALQRALELDGRSFELCKMAGNCAAKLGQVEQALTYYQQAVDTTNDQADSEAYAALGQLHLAQNNTDAAEQMFNRAVEAPGPGEETNYKHKAYAGLANVCASRQQFDKALGYVDRAIKMAGLDSAADSPAYHIQKARLYMDADQDDDAITWLNYTWSEFADTPWRIESARLRAKLYERADDLDKAVNHIQNVTEYHRMTESPSDEALAQFTALLANWQIKADRLDDAKVSLHNLQALMPTHPAIDELKDKLR